MTRRKLLSSSAYGFGLLSAGSVFGRSAEFCFDTPQQPEGPFYPVRDQADKNSDLTLVDGHSQRAVGTVIHVGGTVIDQYCNIVENAVVEIWQACASGRYNHPGDQDNSNALDPNFQYWGITKTNAQGEYSFKTILPGHYKANSTWMRPPHIHFKVYRRGFVELTTQMYFAGNRFNEEDLILSRLSEDEKSSVIVAMTKIEGTLEYSCRFDITLQKV